MPCFDSILEMLYKKEKVLCCQRNGCGSEELPVAIGALAPLKDDWSREVLPLSPPRALLNASI